MASFFNPTAAAPYPLSRSKVELFLDCPRCFYLDRRLGIARIDNMAFTLNLAVDHLLKKEFDFFRSRNEPHPAMTMFGVDAVPYRHKDLNVWRDTRTGIRALHSASNIEAFGLVDDVWQNTDGSLSIVDYKATSTGAPIVLDGRDGYKRQLEFYQWLFRRNNFDVSDTAYLVFVNATRDRDMFDRSLEFVFSIHDYKGSDAWVEDALMGAKECLMRDVAPPSTDTCEWCIYRREAKAVEQ